MVQDPAFSESEAPLKPVVATLGIVIRDGRVLLVRRANPPDVGLWGFPGGKIEFGETLREAVVREVKEETALLVQAKEVVTAVDAFDQEKGAVPRQHFVLVAILCEYLKGTPLAGDDALDARWFDLDTVRSQSLFMSFGVPDVLDLALTKLSDGTE